MEWYDPQIYECVDSCLSSIDSDTIEKLKEIAEEVYEVIDKLTPNKKPEPARLATELKAEALPLLVGVSFGRPVARNKPN